MAIHSLYRVPLNADSSKPHKTNKPSRVYHGTERRVALSGTRDLLQAQFPDQCITEYHTGNSISFFYVAKEKTAKPDLCFVLVSEGRR